MPEVFEKYESNVRSYCRSFPTVFVNAKGAVMTDDKGKKYIDFFSGAGGVNYGHNNDYIKKAVSDYLESDGIIHALDMYTTAKAEFIETFEDTILKPRGFDYKIQFAGPTGTNAVEAALKLARKVKKRRGVFAFMGAFHGMTLGSLSLTTDAASRAGAGVDLENVTHIPTPYMFPELDVVKYIDTIITDDHSGIEKPAAIVLEPVQADGGVYPFEVDFLRGLSELCKKHDILLICDDIQAGCGRCGNFFSFERAGIKPDIVTVSKSIGGFGMPMALVLLKPELDVWTPGEHNGTFRGNQLSLVAAKAGLELFVSQKVDEQVAAKEKIIYKYLKENIETLDSRIITRGIGMLWGVDMSAFNDEELTFKIMHKCFDNGLILERVGRKNEVLKLMPPLVIDEKLMADGLDILKKSVSEIIK